MTRIRNLLLCVAILACGANPASATMRIVDDRRGQVGKYLQAFAKVRSTGERVVIDGDCLSACTLVLGLVPSNQICATSRARFGFHAASIRNYEGRLVTSVKATQAVWNVYPASVRHWIDQHGGLSRQMIYMEGRSLDGIVATCDFPTLRALLVAGASGYSGTLVPMLPQSTRHSSAHSSLPRAAPTLAPPCVPSAVGAGCHLLGEGEPMTLP